MAQTLDNLIRSTELVCPPLVVGEQRTPLAAAALPTPQSPPVHSTSGGFSRYKARSRNGSTSQGTRRDDDFSPQTLAPGGNSTSAAGPGQAGHSDNGSVNKLKLALNLKTATLESIQITDNWKSVQLMKEILRLRSQNGLLKNDIWASLSTLSVNTSEGIPIVDDDEEEGEEDDDEEDDQWGNDEYEPKSNSTTYNKSISNDQLKKILSDYKSYNANISSTIDDYNNALETIMNQMVKMHCSFSTDLSELINDFQSKIKLENDRSSVELGRSVTRLTELGSLGCKILNTFSDL